MKKVLMSLAVAGLALGTLGCEEKPADKMQEAGKKAGEAAKQAGEATKDAAKSAGDAVKDATHKH